jgi:hypothetical protein
VHKEINPVALGRFREPRPDEAPHERTWDEGPKPKEAPKEFKFKPPKEVDEEAELEKKKAEAEKNKEKGIAEKNAADEEAEKHDLKHKAKPIEEPPKEEE